MKAQRKNEAKETGQRLAEFRTRLRYSQNAFAKEIGISRDRLASYETARAALPWEIYARIAKRWRLHPAWLARGVASPMAPFVGDVARMGFPPRTPFLRAFASDARLQQVPQSLTVVDSDKLKGALEMAARELRNLEGTWEQKRQQIQAATWFQEHAATVRGLLTALGEKAREPMQETAPRGVLYHGDGKPTEGENKRLITTPKADLLRSDMATAKQELAALLAKVRERTSQRGMRKQLAAEIKVAPQRITDWLSGKKIPDGLNLLRLQKWVGGSR